MKPSVENQQRRVVSTLVRRNMQGWGRPLDFTLQRLRLGGLFGVAGAFFLVVRQLLVPTRSAFLISFIALLGLLCIAFFASTLFAHVVPFIRARTQSPLTLKGKLEAVICDPQEYTTLARGDYYFITLRPTNGALRAYAVEAAQHSDICARGGQQVTLDIIPGIEHVVGIR
jgi:hypothetical protein